MANKTRVMPVLLLKNGGLVKTVKFKNPKYIGDPVNAVRIFNEKEVDELVFLDISATFSNHGPDFETLKDIVGEAFMPMTYGGGLTCLDHVRRIFSLGFEKIVINSSAYKSMQLVTEAAAIYGTQSIVGCIDVKRSLFGKAELYSSAGNNRQKVELEEHVTRLVEAGAGEVLINSIDRDGTLSGYDLKLISDVAKLVRVPVVACGGASNVHDFVAAVQCGATAVAAGSLFVFYGPHRAVLINYPSRTELTACLP